MREDGDAYLLGGVRRHMRLPRTPVRARTYSLAAFKSPSFQDRVAAASNAKQKALDVLKARPPVDEAVAAEQRRAHDAREQVRSRERAARHQALADAKAEKAAAEASARAEAEAAAALKAARLKPATAADMQAARDARYAARRARR